MHLQELKRYFPPRKADSHKGSYGTLLSVCGSDGMSGAAVLAAKAAQRCGVGLVLAALPRSVYPLAAVQLPEAVCVPLPESEKIPEQIGRALRPALEKATAVLIGCGLGQEVAAVRTVEYVLQSATCPVVLDADGINCAARHIPIQETVRAPLVLTPHPAEMARLLNCSVAEVQANRRQAATACAIQCGGVVVLKGHQTVIASPERGVYYVNHTGNAGMATAGSGDVLAGMISSFLAQGMSAEAAALCGVYLHGLAGDCAAARVSQQSLIASDIIAELGALFLELERAEYRP